MTFSPQRYDELVDANENTINIMRLPSKEQNLNEQKRRYLRRNDTDTGIIQTMQMLAYNIYDSARGHGSFNDDYQPLDESVRFFYGNPNSESDEPVDWFRQWRGWNYSNQQTVNIPGGWSVSSGFKEFPKYMDKEFISDMRIAVDGLFRPPKFDGAPFPEEYDPENPYFPWSQPILNTNFQGWEREIAELRYCARSLGRPATYRIYNTRGIIGEDTTEILMRVRNGPWGVAPFTYYPYPAGGDTPDWYDPISTVDLDLCAAQVNIKGYVGLFWAIGGYTVKITNSQRTASRILPDGGFQYSTSTEQYQSAKSMGISCYGPISYDGELVGCTGSYDFGPYIETSLRDGFAILNVDNRIVIDDQYLSEYMVHRYAFYVVVQHPKIPSIFLKTVRDDLIYLPGVQPWISYFPGFNMENWPKYPEGE